MALAAGVALGGGPLSDVGRRARAEAAAPPATDRGRDRAAYADAFAGTVGPALYAGRLHGHPVVLLALPGADADAVAALAEQVQAAGTRSSARYGLRAPWSTRRRRPSSTPSVSSWSPSSARASSRPAPRPTTGSASSSVVPWRLEAVGRAARPRRRGSLRASLQGADLLALPDGEPDVAPLRAGRGAATSSSRCVLTGLVYGLAAVARGSWWPDRPVTRHSRPCASTPPTRPVATVDGTDTVGRPGGRRAGPGPGAGTPGGSFGASGSDGPAARSGRMEPREASAHQARVRDRGRRLLARQGTHGLLARACCSVRAACASPCRSSTPTSTSTPGR